MGNRRHCTCGVPLVVWLLPVWVINNWRWHIASCITNLHRHTVDEEALRLKEEMEELERLKQIPGQCYFEFSDALVVQMTAEAQQEAEAGGGNQQLVWHGERLPGRYSKIGIFCGENIYRQDKPADYEDGTSPTNSEELYMYFSESPKNSQWHGWFISKKIGENYSNKHRMILAWAPEQEGGGPPSQWHVPYTAEQPCEDFTVMNYGVYMQELYASQEAGRNEAEAAVETYQGWDREREERKESNRKKTQVSGSFSRLANLIAKVLKDNGASKATKAMAWEYFQADPNLAKHPMCWKLKYPIGAILHLTRRFSDNRHCLYVTTHEGCYDGYGPTLEPHMWLQITI